MSSEVTFGRKVFGEDGALAAAFEGYKPRPGQVKMAGAVSAAMAAKSHLVVEGPCGVGKSVAYLVPSIKHAIDTGTSVIIATANIALQEQLVGKDLPMLQGVLGRLGLNFSFQLVKGRNNYLCKSEVKDLKEKPENGNLFGGSDLDELTKILEWAESTTTGDVSELDFLPTPKVWSKVSTSADECLGSECPFRDTCFAEMSKARAQTVQVVVTNYHMLIAHLRVSEMTDGKVQLLPPYTVVVCDEAHKLADIARGFFGFELSSGSVARTLDGIKKIDQPLADRIEYRADEFFAQAKAFCSSKQYRTRFKRPPPFDYADLVADLGTMASAVRRAIASSSEEEGKKLKKKVERLNKLQDTLVSVCTLRDSECVYFAKEEGKTFKICVQYKRVGPLLNQMLWSKIDTGIVTSATLRVGRDFEYVKTELGLDLATRKVESLGVDSPFDFLRNARLVIPNGLVDPTFRPQYDPRMSQEERDRNDPLLNQTAALVRDTIRHTGGRTLGLFTSHRALKYVAANLGKIPYAVHVQGTSQRTALTAAFKEDETSCLLGTESFWAGVDAPGSTLSAVVIDKFPFPSPEDPILDAISEEDPKWFFNYSLPRMIIQLSQGAGRLIRSVNDRGIIVIGDCRMTTKGYGNQVRESLPRMLIETDIATALRAVGITPSGE